MQPWRLPALVASGLIALVAAFPGDSATGVRAGSSPIITRIASTIPPNGDLHPAGVAVVPATTGKLQAGSILVSNFNNSHNLKGTGTTIDEIAPSGAVRVFAQITQASLPKPCPGGIGLTAGLIILSGTMIGDLVLVGSVPTTNGTAATAGAGCLILLDAGGTPIAVQSGPLINGPWGLVAGPGSVYTKTFYFTNVLNGTVAGSPHTVNQGTIVRAGFHFSGGTTISFGASVIGSGFPARTDPSALVIGPTGLGFSITGSLDGTLYVADSVDNRIAAIPNAASRTTSAGIGTTVSAGGALNDPLGLAINPKSGNITTVNGNNGNEVVTSPAGKQLAVQPLTTGSPPDAGTLFGLAFTPDGSGLYFVDDGNNTLNLLH
jgi:hypothetical protein